MKHACMHGCPNLVGDKHSHEDLRKLLEEDERYSTQYQCVVELSRRAKTSCMEDEKLCMMAEVYSCMQRNAWAIPIQREGVELMLAILKTERNPSKLTHVCPGVRDYLMAFERVPSLKHKVKAMMDEKTIECDNDAAQILIQMKHKSI